MLDPPAVFVGHQDVSVSAAMVETDVADDGEVRRDLRLIGSDGGEQHIGHVVPDYGFDACTDADTVGDDGEERRELYRARVSRIFSRATSSQMSTTRVLSQRCQPYGAGRARRPSPSGPTASFTRS